VILKERVQLLQSLREVVKGKKILCTQVHRRKKESDTAKLIKQLGATQLQLLLGRVVVHSTNSEASTRFLELDRPSHILLQLAAHNNVLLVEVVALMSLAVNSLVLVHMQNTSLVMKKLVQFLFIREKGWWHFHHTLASRIWLTISDWNASCTYLVNAFHDAVKDL